MTILLAFAHPGIRQSEIRDLSARLSSLGGSVLTRYFYDRTLLIVSGNDIGILDGELAASEQIGLVLNTSRPHPLASRDARPQDTVVRVGNVEIGGGRPVLIAGPCSAENSEVLIETAASVKASGAAILRVGIFKPRTSPYSFQGLGRKGVAALHHVRSETGLPVVTEIMSVRDLDILPGAADMLQIGARNMQNFSLLAEVAGAGRPVLLKRGLAATVADWLNAAEYLLANGTIDVVLCERGIRTFERTTRFTLDLACVPVVKELSHLPVILDPSHGTGAARYVGPLAAAGIAVGADGLIIEVHPRPQQALSDGDQSLDLAAFTELAARLRMIGAAAGRPVAAPDRVVSEVGSGGPP